MAFDPFQYIASYRDLIGAFGANAAAGLQHYNQFGQFEGRQQDLFNETQYLANYRDLQLAFGNNTNAATVHYINFGSREGRTDAAPLPAGFDGLQYIASYDDLIDAFGANPVAGAQHYTQFGRAESREVDDFNEQQYLANYPDLAAAFTGNGGAATLHYILFGKEEGRNDDRPGNSPPAAVDDAFDIAANGDRTSLNVLRNDSDPDASDRLTVVAVDDVSTRGAIELSGNGRVFYDPNGAFDDVLIGQTTTDTFRYTISDSSGAKSTAEVTITVDGTAVPPPGNNPPTAVDDAFDIAADGDRTSLDVLRNDSDPDASDRLTVVSVDDLGAQGSIELSGNGRVFYDPDGAFDELLIGQTGTDTFRYTIADSAGAQSTAQVTITVDGTAEPPPSNNPPTAVNDGFQVAVDAEPTLLDVLLNDTDPDMADALSVISVESSKTVGTVTLAEGMITYEPSDAIEEFPATDTFTYTIADGAGGQSTAEVSITVTGPTAQQVSVAVDFLV